MANNGRVIALGFFDGVHKAHGVVLSRAAQRAAERNAAPCAFTFDVHPSVRLTGKAVPLITSLEDRAWLMHHYYGIEEMIPASFDRMMTMSWEDFIDHYLAEEMHAVHVVCGHDFHFGYKGQGNPQRLQERCAARGIGCDIIDRVELDHVTVHSTYIRSLIAEGKMEEARHFLGHPHVLSQVVSPGKHLGNRLGFPTVNLSFEEGVIVPAYGVYATRVLLENGTRAIAVTNVGVRPTVEQTGVANVEGYILDYTGDLYGQRVRMAFYKHLRGERKFPNVEELTRVVMENAQQTRDYFRSMDWDF